MTSPDDAFSYLAVFYSIILGLAFTEILQGFRRLFLARKGLVVYSPPLIFAFTLLLVLAQTWWSLFKLRAYGHWSFAPYGMVLLHCVVLYMICALALPNDKDMRAGYVEHSRPFFVLIMVAAAVGLVRDAIIYGPPKWEANLWFQLAIAASAGVAAVTRNRWYHLVLALTFAASYLAYVALLFAQL